MPAISILWIQMRWDVSSPMRIKRKLSLISKTTIPNHIMKALHIHGEEQ